MTDKATVQDAIASVMAEVPSIGKGDRSPEGYQYRGIEAITKHVQPLFAKYGVVVAPHARITEVRPSPAMKDGWTDVYMEVGWTITGPDGSQLHAQTTGIGRDRTDKGANKAQQQAYKYLLLHLLCIADSKDDSDSHDYEGGRAERADAACPKCGEVVTGAGSDKEPMRVHMIETHGYSRNEDGSVSPPAEKDETVVVPATSEPAQAKAALEGAKS